MNNCNHEAFYLNTAYEKVCANCHKPFSEIYLNDPIPKISIYIPVSEKINTIWREMKKLKRLREGNFTIEEYENEERDILENKYQNIEILFGHESTLDKAIIYYLDQQQNEKAKK